MVAGAQKREDSIFYSLDDQSYLDTSNVLKQQANVQDRLDYERAMEQNRKEDVVTKSARIIYWVSLFAAIVGNFISSVILVPFIVMLETRLTLYSVVMILGLVFGALFNFLLNDIQRLDPTHQVVSGAVIPALAVINVYIMVEVAKTVGTALEINVNQSAVIISILYVSMFTIPYFLGMVFRHYRLVKA